MAIFTVGPNSTFPSIAAAMAAAGPGDTIQLEAGYSNETATVTHSGMIITGEASSLGIVLQLGSGIATVALAGAAPIDLVDAADGNGILGNDGDNLITVTGGADAVAGGLGNDRLFVDYRLATGAVTGDSTSNFAEAGGGARLVTVNGGVEHFTVWTGSGADTITTGAGDDDIRTGEGAGTVTAGEGFNYVTGGSGADTIVAGSGGNYVHGGDGTNTITTGGGIDEIVTGLGADTIVAGAGEDRVTAVGGADTVDAGAGGDLLIVDYSAAVTAVTGGVTGGDLAGGYSGHLADLAAATLDFVEAEQFWITTGTGDDTINTGAADDRITTGAGSDFLNGGKGADIMTGGAGNDLYRVEDAGDRAVEAVGGGFDAAYVGLALGSYTLQGGSEIELLSAIDPSSAVAFDLTGNEFGNTIIGTAGSNTLIGGGGNDVLAGGAGNDLYRVEDAGDALIEGAGGGFDAAYVGLSVGSYTLRTDSEIELLSAIDTASTAALDLIGNGIGNTIIGTNGANMLNGRGGADVLKGFGGADTFAFTSALGSGNVDRILDFASGTDAIALDDAVFAGLGLGALGAGAFATGAAASDADDRIVYNGATGQLFFDADGNGAGAAVQFATLAGAPILTAADFMVI